MPQPKSKKPSRKKPHKFDAGFKDLVERQAPDILPLFLPGTVYERTLNVEAIRSPIRADKVFKVLYHGKEHILHLECETRSDRDLRSRLLVYNSVLYQDYKLPVITIVVYPFPVEQAESPLCIKSTSKDILTFNFQTLPLFTLEAEQFVQEHRACIYPFLPTMNGVHAEMMAQVMQELTEIYRDDMDSLSRQFSWMTIFLERTDTIKSLEKDRIEERLKMFDQLWNESPRVQRMKKQFREESQKEAEQERMRLRQEFAKRQQELEQEFAKRLQETEQELAKQQQELAKQQQELAKRLQQETAKRLQQETAKVKADQAVKVRRSLLVNVTSRRFPQLTQFAQQQVEQFDKPEILDQLTEKMTIVPDANTAILLLTTHPEALEE